MIASLQSELDSATLVKNNNIAALRPLQDALNLAIAERDKIGSPANLAKTALDAAKGRLTTDPAIVTAKTEIQNQKNLLTVAGGNIDLLKKALTKAENDLKFGSAITTAK